MENDTRKLVLYVGKVKPDYSYGSQVFEYHIVTQDDAGRVRNCSDSDPLTANFDDLMFRCQISRGMCDNKPFAYSCEYRSVWSVDLRAAERMVKMLRKIDKASEKWAIRPETFGQYVALMCQSLGIAGAVQVADPTRSNGWHDETEHVSWKASDIQYLVDRQISEFMTEHGERRTDGCCLIP